MNFVENARASSARPCPVCGKSDWCFLTIDSAEGLIQAVCGRTVQSPPAGWIDTGTRAKDGRVIYRSGNASTAHRQRFPKRIEWRRWDLQPGPEWQPRPAQESFDRGDKVRKIKGKDQGAYLWEGYQERGKCKVSRDGVVIESFADQWDLLTSDGKEQELEITYLYPDADGRPVGRVRRRQWSDRRPWYERDSLKTKELRPFHAVKSTDPEHPWVWKLGRGEQTWPLYRQREALDAIDRGEPVFVVAGEQAVEVMARLGFVAVSPQGGENRQGDVISNIGDHLRQAYRLGAKPILLLWPDADPTGRMAWGGLQSACNNQDLLAATLSPTECWAEMPDGGDVADMFRAFRGQIDQLRTAIINAAEQAIDRQERILKAAQQRKHWGAPEERGAELGFIRTRKALKSEAEKANDDGLIEIWKPKTDFNFKIVRELIGSDGGGLQLAVKLADYRQERRIRVGTEDCSSKTRFQGAIAKGVGRNVICNLKDEELQALLRVRLLEYRLFEEGLSFRLADRIGRQADGHWIFRERQFSPDGSETNEQRSGWCWNEALTDNETAFKSPAVVAPNTDALPNLAITAKHFFGQNWPIVLLTMGYIAAACHYEEIMGAEDSFPILNLYGDAGSGKTQAAVTALAMVGQHKDGLMADVSVSAAYERLQTAGGLAHCLDDPKRDDSLSDFFKALYNAKSRVVRGRDGKKFASQTPHSPLFFTSNMALGEDHQAARSRLVKIFVPPIQGGDKTAYPELEQARAAASGCLPDLIHLTYDANAVKAMERDIKPHLSKAHDRIPRSFALVLHYAQRIAILAKDTTPIVDWAIANIFPNLNTAEEAGDSLLDFVEKVWALRTQGELGDWNVRIINKLGSRALALHITSVWPVVERAYRLPYDLSNLKAVIKAKGGDLAAIHKFHADKMVSMASIKDGSKARQITQRCIEIPWALLENAIYFSEICENDVNHVNQPDQQASNQDWATVTPVTKNVNQTQKHVNRFTSESEEGEGTDPPLGPSGLHGLHRLQPDVTACNQDHQGILGLGLHGLHDLHTNQDFDQKNGQNPKSVPSAENDQCWEVPARLQRGDRIWAWAGDRWESAEYLGKYTRGQRLSALTGKLESGIRIRWTEGTREEIAIALPDCRVKSEHKSEHVSQ